MITLRELFNRVENDSKSGLISLDDWKLTEVDYFNDMGFSQDGEHSLRLNNPPIKVYKKKRMTHELATEMHAVGEGYVVEDLKKDKKYTFPTFKKMVEFFDNYEQDFKN